MRSLLTLAELGSISQTGTKLHLSPGAIHKQIKVLETELGVRLYEKVGRHLQMTQAADILMPYYRDMLAQNDSAIAAMEEWNGLGSGVVRVGSGPSSYMLPAILKKFREANPAVDILVETGNTPVLMDELRKGSLDLAFIVSTDLVEEPDWCVESHWQFQMLLVSHERCALKRPRIAALKHLRFILFRKGSRMQSPIDRYFAAHGLEPNVIMRFDSTDFIRNMVRTGLGVSMLPSWVVDKDVKDGQLHIIRQAEPPLCSNIALIRRKSSFVPRAVLAFIETARRLDLKTLSQ